ncbi:DUF2247 family protein [Listeria seeligeri]|uniref:DUF2247 family protein n=1 Tax=Listeria seeligeri TaxID=1640 RepID=UPI0035DCDE72
MYIYNYAKMHDINNTDIKSRFLHILLNWLWDNKQNYNDPLAAIDYIYADFDYPEEIANLVRYMLMQHKDMGRSIWFKINDGINLYKR